MERKMVARCLRCDEPIYSDEEIVYDKEGCYSHKKCLMDVQKVIEIMSGRPNVEFCPRCGSTMEWNDFKVALVCTNPECRREHKF